MKILIVGQGAMGSLLGVKLSKAGYNVDFVVRNPLRAEIIKREGIALFEGEKHYVSHFDNIYLFDELKTPIEADYAIFATKAYDLINAAEKIAGIIPKNTGIITMQNGMECHIKISKIFGAERHAILSMYDAAFSFSLNQIRHTGKGKNILTSFQLTKDLNEIKSILSKSGFDVRIEKEPFRVLYTKLFINSIVNPITAILGTKNGYLLYNQPSFTIVTLLIEELIEIANKINVSIEPDKFQKTVVKSIEKSAENKSSMLQDIEWKRKTEIEDILGYLLKIAKEYKVNTPNFNILYHLICAIQNKYLKS